MRDGEVEPVRYPRNPLDVLAQQMVAMVAMDATDVDDALRGRAPGRALRAAQPRRCSTACSTCWPGNQVSDDFAELRPRLNWDRVTGKLEAREGARRIAVISGGTIPDRGLFGVFLAGGGSGGAAPGWASWTRRWCSRAGWARPSCWAPPPGASRRSPTTGCWSRPRPGEPGKMPFWRGEAAGRTVELGRMVGALTRELRGAPAQRRPRHPGQPARPGRAGGRQPAGLPARPGRGHRGGARRSPRGHRALPRRAGRLAGLRAVAAGRAGARALGHGGHGQGARRAGPGRRDHVDRRRLRGPLPRERRAARLRRCCCPTPEELEALVLRQLGSIGPVRRQVPRGGRPRAAAAPALPRPARAAVADAQEGRRSAGGGRAPAVVPHPAGGLPGMPARRVRPAGAGRGAARDRAAARSRSRRSPRPRRRPSPSGLLFGYVANYIYDGDAPLAERRAQALTVDEALLRELLGEAELRELLDPDCVSAVEEELQQLPERLRARSADGVHDLLLRLGDLDRREIERRALGPAVAATIDELVIARRAVELSVGGQRRFVAAEHASRYRDALGAALPPGLPEAFRRSLGRSAGRAAAALRPHPRPLPGRRARRAAGAAAPSEVEPVLHRLAAESKLVEGAFLRGHTRARVVRPGGAAQHPPPLAGPPAQGGRAGRAGGAGPLRHPLAGGHAGRAAARASTPCWTRSKSCRGCRCPPRRWSARSCRRGWRATCPAISTPWRRPARSSGWGSRRWAAATGGWRCT